MSVTNESPKHEAINFINQQSQTPAESVYGAKTNRCGTAVERRGVDGGGTTVVIGADPYHDSVSLSHMFAFFIFFLLLLVCHGVAYCSDVYANEPKLTDEDRWA